MYEFSATELILSFLFTWVVGLTPPVLIRFTFLKRPIEKWPAIGICVLIWVCNIVLFTALGSRSKTHGALLLIAFVSYAILRRQGKSPDHEAISVETKKAEPQANPASRLNKLSRWARLLVVVSTSWLLFATITYFLALDGNSWLLGLVPSSAFSWSVDLFSAPNPVGDLPVYPTFNGIGFSTFVVAPVILSWGVGWIGVRLFRWVRAGS